MKNNSYRKKKSNIGLKLAEKVFDDKQDEFQIMKMKYLKQIVLKVFYASIIITTMLFLMYWFNGDKGTIVNFNNMILIFILLFFGSWLVVFSVVIPIIIIKFVLKYFFNISGFSRYNFGLLFFAGIYIGMISLIIIVELSFMLNGKTEQLRSWLMVNIAMNLIAIFVGYIQYVSYKLNNPFRQPE